MSPIRHHKKIHVEEVLQGELCKIMLPTFDGENKKGEDVKDRLLGMGIYLRLHNYSILRPKFSFIIYRGRL